MNVKPGDVTILISLIEIAQKAIAAIGAIKADNPEAYKAVGDHHASALAKLEAVANR